MLILDAVNQRRELNCKEYLSHSVIVDQNSYGDYCNSEDTKHRIFEELDDKKCFMMILQS